MPFALRDAGLLVFVALLFLLAFFMARINYFYRQVVDAVKERHQLPGYVEKILGKREKFFASLLLLFSNYGALLAYIILGGNFISGFSGITAQSASLLFWLLATAALLLLGKWLETLDVVLSLLKIILFALIIGVSFVFVRLPANLPLIGTDPLFAYGQILFTLTGFSIVPELSKDKHMAWSIYTASLIVSLLYLSFALFLFPFVEGSGFVFRERVLNILFNLTGSMAVLTPYLMLSWVGYDLFNKDFGFEKKSALVLTTTIPLFLFVLGIHNFSSVISFTGAVFLGGLAVLINRMYRKKFPEKDHALNLLVETVFIVGIILELYHFLSG